MTDTENNASASAPVEGEGNTAQLDLSNYVEKDYVNKIVQESKNKGYQNGYEAAKKELESKLNQHLEQKQDSRNHDGLPHNQYDDERIKKLAHEELSRALEEQKKLVEQQQLEAQANRLLQELSSKAEEAAKKYDDFDDVTSQINFQEVPEVLMYANSVDNAGDVLYDLAKNPHKIASLRSSTPSLAMAQIKRISDSIKNNEHARSDANAPPVLDRMSPSNVGGVDRELSRVEQLRALKKKYI